MRIGTHGRTFVGKVIADRMHKTVTVEWDRRKYNAKYERYEKKRTRVKAHNPEEINAKAGQIVIIMETRPLSKTKKFIVTKVLEEGDIIEAQSEASELGLKEIKDAKEQRKKETEESKKIKEEPKKEEAPKKEPKGAEK